ncbi:hypothetical protein DL89DRAFT_139818 [Linderina pennispora]|uniref:Uncharacterized protein n=1 Tax=Linderina pennispora TaxID=61395 RepID=A0A1Y1WBL4_9FUNG|nr:uncharacterized protein DL89DRAFT_139818 [Linderina pennispora]ORX70755.1 hypothetical protein DL89DRAFT_139818 [Linderina pennispora]
MAPVLLCCATFINECRWVSSGCPSSFICLPLRCSLALGACPLPAARGFAVTYDIANDACHGVGRRPDAALLGVKGRVAGVAGRSHGS